MIKIKYGYCKISPDRDKYVVEYGHNTYKGYTLSSPIKVADRAFFTEKKAVRFAKKIVPVECIKKKKSRIYLYIRNVIFKIIILTSFSIKIS
jgi:hypothetical protein